MRLKFYKYQGTGNDFIILDNRKGEYSNLTTHQVNFLCNRRFGIGADGLMLLNLKPSYDFEMKYYNADGRESSMCGNGGRCPGLNLPIIWAFTEIPIYFQLPMVITRQKSTSTAPIA